MKYEKKNKYRMGELKHGPTTVASVRLPETTIAVIDEMAKSVGETKGQFIANAIIHRMIQVDMLSPGEASKAALENPGNAKFIELLKKWLVSDEREETELPGLFEIPDIK